MLNSNNDKQNIESRENFTWVEAIWKIVKDNYVRFDESQVNWDVSLQNIRTEFKQNPYTNVFDMIDVLLYGLKDPHTKLLRSNAYNRYILPLSICALTNGFYITAFSGEFSNVVVGSKLLAVDGVSLTDLCTNMFQKVGYISNASIKSEVINQIIFKPTLQTTSLTLEKDTIIHDIEVRYVDVVQYIERCKRKHMTSLNTCKQQELIKDSDILYFQAYSFMEKDICKRFIAEVGSCGSKDYLIIDIRYNSGGLIDVAKEFTSMFIEHEVFLGFEKSISDKVPLVLNPNSRLVDQFKKIIILCNEMTSSSAEYVFIRALKNHSEKIVVVGEKTAGMAHVATVYTLKNDFKLQVTTKKYLDTEGETIEEEGINPDVLIENGYEWISKGVDLQLQKAIEIIKKSGVCNA